MAKQSPAAFMRQVRQEGRKVTWPGRRETTVTTIMVFIMACLMAIFFFAADFVIDGLLSEIFVFPANVADFGLGAALKAVLGFGPAA